jgi:tRNA (pseudouridine54-N1)-methyltransferase
MREIVYYSKSAVTAGNFIQADLMKSGRMDIVCNVIISAFFLSNDIRKDVRLHLLFEGPPTPPVHIQLEYDSRLSLSKKDIAGLIKRMLYKCPKEKNRLLQVFPGCSIEKKSFENLINELNNQGRNVFMLEEKGKDIRTMKFCGNELFIIGDHEGFPQEKVKFLRTIDKISLSPKILFASQAITILHNEIDRQEKQTS